MASVLKQRWTNDKWFRFISIAIIVLFLLGFGLQSIWGSDPADSGEVVLGGGEDIFELSSNESVVYSYTFNSGLNFIGVAANDPIQIRLVEGANSSQLNSSILDTNTLFSDITESLSYWYEQSGTLTLVMNNTTTEDIKYRFEFRVYAEEDRSKFANFGLGGLFYNIAILIFLIYILIFVILPKLPFMKRGQESFSSE